MFTKKNKFSEVKKILEKQQYAVIGNHSAVKICQWTKNSLNKKGCCWKEKFYGIKSHRCAEFSPSVMWCENKCMHCWRPIEYNLGTKLSKVDEPKEIIENIIKERKKLLIGFKGNKNVNDKKFEEALEPTLFTFSLSGEPTIYPRLDELIQEVRRRNAFSFLVTNGLNPEAIKRLEDKNSLPTQLTVSVNASNKELFKVWHRSSIKNPWEKLNNTLDLMKELKGKTRRVIRLTLVKEGKDNTSIGKLSNMKEEHIKEYAELIKKADPDFVHIKAFKSVGFSRERFGYDKMPWHYEIKRFAEKLKDELKEEDYKILGEEKMSCVVLLGKDKKMMKIKKI
ncbi:MAG: 4-demethylwyosine synthase TYW1 [Nanoarchaeota archaeon]